MKRNMSVSGVAWAGLLCLSAFMPVCSKDIRAQAHWDNDSIKKSHWQWLETPVHKREDFVIVKDWRELEPGQVSVGVVMKYDTKVHTFNRLSNVKFAVNKKTELLLSEKSGKVGGAATLMFGTFKPGKLLYGLRIGYNDTVVSDKLNVLLMASYFKHGGNYTANLNLAKGKRTPGFNQFHPGVDSNQSYLAIGYMGKDQIKPMGKKVPSRLGIEAVRYFDGRLVLAPVLLQDLGDFRLKLSYARAMNRRDEQGDWVMLALDYGF